MATHIERFAPSPTGYLHLGHAFSALTAWDAAQKAKGTFLLRFEDLDAQRVQPEYYEAIKEDLRWLGIAFEPDPLLQSTRVDAYDAALGQLEERGLAYRCTCTRKDIADAATAPHGPDGAIYPGTCRSGGAGTGDAALRLDMRKALASLGGAGVIKKLHFKETGRGPNGERKKITLDPSMLIEACGDVVLRRKDGVAAYHLAVVLDDAQQGVTHVTRGNDLFPATQIHRVLQALFGRPTPLYNHHRLIEDDCGKRLAKRSDAYAIRSLRDDGLSPSDIRERLGIK